MYSYITVNCLLEPTPIVCQKQLHCTTLRSGTAYDLNKITVRDEIIMGEGDKLDYTSVEVEDAEGVLDIAGDVFTSVVITEMIIKILELV